MPCFQSWFVRVTTCEPTPRRARGTVRHARVRRPGAPPHQLGASLRRRAAVGAVLLTLLFAVLAGTARAAPRRILDEAPGSAPAVKRIYLANDDHTDYVWAATEEQYRAAFLDMLDYYMDLADLTATNPPDARSRFNCDGSLWVWEYEQNRPPGDFERLVSHLRDGTITMPLQTCVILCGAMPAEAVLRNMYYAGRLERRLGLRFPLVLAMEDQTLPGGVASLWAGSGARYSWRGICGCATRIDAADRPREIYHFRGPDGQSVCMKWNSKIGPTLLGTYLEARDPWWTVDYLDSDPDFARRWPWKVSAAFGYGGDDLKTTTDVFVITSLLRSDSTLRVIVSNEIDFFEDFLAEYGDAIPTFSGGFGNEWDLYTASMGEVTADFKRHVEKLRSAEALATVASLWHPGFMSGREAARDSAFQACGLFYEHDWTADGPLRGVRARFERDQLGVFGRYVDALHEDAGAEVAGLVAQPPGVERHLVFNPLSWTRTDFADLATSLPPPRHVVDVASGIETPSEPVTVDGAARLRILAGVPSVGYRVYEVRPGAGGNFPPSASVSLPAFDNGLYRVSLGPHGSITSVVDHKDADRELVDAGGGGAILDLGSGDGEVTVEHQGPVSTTLRVVAGGSPAHEARVTLYGGLDRIDVEGRVTENFGQDLGYRSAFDLPGASIRHEEVGMIARVARAADGGDYADQNTRTDFLTFNHFVDLSRSERGVTISNWDSPFFATGQSTPTVLDTTPVITAVVGMQMDGPGLGIPDQGGDSLFLDRFALRTHTAYDQGSAMRFALEHQNPLVALRVTGGANAPLPADQWSLISLPSPDVLLWALKPAEEGIAQGVIARLWNLAEAPRVFTLAMPDHALAAARHATHIETGLRPAPVVNGELVDRLERQQMATYRLTPTGVVASAPGPQVRSVRLSVFPNPARGQGASSIAYTLPAGGEVRLTVHDLRGALVAMPVNGVREAGPHLVRWDGRGAGGADVSPGIYFVRIRAADQVVTTKLVRLR